MWKLMKTILPNKKESLPTGKFNNQGQIVTDSEELKDLYLNEFKERLRIRLSLPDFIKNSSYTNHNENSPFIFQLKLRSFFGYG